MGVCQSTTTHYGESHKGNNVEKAIITINGEDLIVKYDHEKGQVSLLGKGIDLQFQLHHFTLVYGAVLNMQCHAIQEDSVRRQNARKEW